MKLDMASVYNCIQEITLTNALFSSIASYHSEVISCALTGQLGQNLKVYELGGEILLMITDVAQPCDLLGSALSCVNEESLMRF